MKSLHFLPERVWMEELEGRVLLSGGTQLDLSHPNDIQGSGSATFSFQAKADQRYLFIDLDYNEFYIYDDQAQIAESDLDSYMVARLVWKAPHTGTYTLWIDGDGGYDYELIARKWSDDFGNDRDHASLLQEGQLIRGEIEDVDDEDVFEFHGEAGVRYAFNAHSENVGAGVYDQSGRAT